MSRPPRKTQSDNGLLTSLRVLSEIEPTLGKPYETHVLLKDNWATMYNGIIAGGERITENLNICPQSDLLIQALSKCGQTIAYTQLDTGRLSIKSDKFRAIIPCLPLDEMPIQYPDEQIAVVDDRLKVAISAVSPLSKEGDDSIVTASILINRGSVLATDRQVMIEYWHGIDLPPYLALPKAIIDPLTRNVKKLSGFGLSSSSCTFHFEDKSWLRSQFFAEKWPDIRPILDISCSPDPLPEGFYEAVKALEPFSDDGYVYFDTNVMRSHRHADAGASYEVPGLPRGPIMKIKQLKMIQSLIKTVDFQVRNKHNQRMTFWFGENVRGAISGRTDE